MSANGGSGGTYGGGGGGGRIGLHYSNDSFIGTTQATGGGSGYEVGGAGTVLRHHTVTSLKTLHIDNAFRSPGPVATRTDYDIAGSEESCRTWLLPSLDGQDEY